MKTPEQLNQSCENKLPYHLGICVTHVSKSELRSEMKVQEYHMAPNGYLHAGSIVTLADTSCGHGCLVNLPDGASGFTTVELKSNFLGSAMKGTIECTAKPSHLGRTTHVWDAVATHRESGKTIALFRCTQMIMY